MLFPVTGWGHHQEDKPWSPAHSWHQGHRDTSNNYSRLRAATPEGGLGSLSLPQFTAATHCRAAVSWELGTSEVGATTPPDGALRDHAYCTARHPVRNQGTEDHRAQGRQLFRQKNKDIGCHPHRKHRAFGRSRAAHTRASGSPWWPAGAPHPARTEQVTGAEQGARERQLTPTGSDLCRTSCHPRSLH